MGSWIEPKYIFQQFEDLTTYGELAAEGTFRMWGAKGLRHVFLFDKMILIAKKKEENILMYKTHILVSALHINHYFRIHCYNNNVVCI